MSISHSQVLRFSKRISVTTETFRLILAQAKQNSQALRFATVDQPGKSRHISTEVELLELSPEAINEAHEVHLFLEGGKGTSWSVNFTRLFPDGQTQPSIPTSQLRSSSSDPHFSHTLIGLRAQLEALFADTQPLSKFRFTSCSPSDTYFADVALDEPPIEALPVFLQPQSAVAVEIASVKKEPAKVEEPIDSQADDEGAKLTEAERSWWKTPAIIVALITAVLITWQAVTGTHQAGIAGHQATTGDRNLDLEASATFTGRVIERPRTPEIDEHIIKHHLEPFFFQLQNVGRGVATNVHLRCGDRDDMGPYGDLGTIPPGPPIIVSSWLTSDKDDVLHQRDYLCSARRFLIYDDRSGHHVVSFDRAGNATAAQD